MTFADWELARPLWLLAAGVLPVTIWLARTSQAGLSRGRWWLATALRCAAVGLLVLALAEPQALIPSNDVCTLFVLDLSESVPGARRDEALAKIARVIGSRANPRDRAGILVVGKEARLVWPPDRYPANFPFRVSDRTLDTRQTHLAGAIRLALAAFPPQTARRVVLFSDGNQTMGDALLEADDARRNHIPIDVVALEYHHEAETLVEKVEAPAELKLGDPAEVRVLLRASAPASGTLVLTHVAAGVPRDGERPLNFGPGARVERFLLPLEATGLHQYTARWRPTEGDAITGNNVARGFTRVPGAGRVLLVAPTPSPRLGGGGPLHPDRENADRENAERENAERGARARLVQLLRMAKLEVTVSTNVPDDLEQWYSYDLIILANVPATQLPEAKQKLLVAGVRELGMGFIMVGGPESFGAGGYTGTLLADSLPVELDLKATLVRPKGALALVMHANAAEMPDGLFWQKKVARMAVRSLGTQDECGLVYWFGNVDWLFPMQPVGNRAALLGAIDNLAPGDMPDFAPAINLALEGLRASPAAIKHVIILSDGDPSPPSEELLAELRAEKITCSTVSIGPHSKPYREQMARIARETKGQAYEVDDPQNLPRIFLDETRAVSRPLIHERPQPWVPRRVENMDPVADLPLPLPPIQGLVLTVVKENATAAIVSPDPPELPNTPVVAHWRYGLGRVAAVTTDLGARWAVDWPPEFYNRFWLQLARWSLRGSAAAELSLQAVEEGGRVTVVAHATGNTAQHLRFAPLAGRWLGQDARAGDLDFRATEPGRFVAHFAPPAGGVYLIQLGYQRPDGGREWQTTGVQVAEDREFRDLQSNLPFLAQVAQRGGGRVIPWSEVDGTDFFTAQQAPPPRRQTVWPEFAFTALVLFALDVAARRLQPDFAGWWAWWRRPPAEEASSPTVERLRAAKASERSWMRRRAGEQPPPSAPTAPPSAPASPPDSSAPPEAAPTTPNPQPTSTEDYTNRLLRAKRGLWKDRDQDTSKPSES